MELEKGSVSTDSQVESLMAWAFSVLCSGVAALLS